MLLRRSLTNVLFLNGFLDWDGLDGNGLANEGLQDEVDAIIIVLCDMVWHRGTLWIEYRLPSWRLG